MSILSMMLVAVLDQAGLGQQWIEDHAEAYEEYAKACRQKHADYVKDHAEQAAIIIETADANIAEFEKVPIRKNKGPTVVRNGKTISFSSEMKKQSAIRAEKERRKKGEAMLEEVAYLKDNLKLMPLKDLSVNSLGAVSSFVVEQVADGKHARVKFAGFSDDVWLEYPTATMVDEKRYGFANPKLAIIVGTKQYARAVGGTRTIPAVVIVDSPPIDPARKD